MTADATVKLPVTVTRAPGRGAGWVATYGAYPHDIEARGATAGQAKERLTAALMTALETILTAQPQFGRDDDGAFLAAVPTVDGGSRHWRITDTAWGGTITSSPTSEAFEGCYHQTIIPNR